MRFLIQATFGTRLAEIQQLQVSSLLLALLGLVLLLYFNNREVPATTSSRRDRK